MNDEPWQELAIPWALEDHGLSVKTINLLDERDVRTLGQLAEMSLSDVLAIPGANRGTVAELRAALSSWRHEFTSTSRRQ